MHNKTQRILENGAARALLQDPTDEDHALMSLWVGASLEALNVSMPMSMSPVVVEPARHDRTPR